MPSIGNQREYEEARGVGNIERGDSGSKWETNVNDKKKGLTMGERKVKGMKVGNEFERKKIEFLSFFFQKKKESRIEILV